MQIQWFPGHMHKAAKAVRESLPAVDVLIEILDARIPYSSQNPMIAEIIADKPTIKLLNKYYMADEARTREWQQWLEQQRSVRTLTTQAVEQNYLEPVTELCRKLVPHKVGGDQNIQAMVIGIPNVGKSTLINSLAGRMVAKTGNEPAVTQRQQRIKLETGITLIDTPGMMWPRIEHEQHGYRLAATGAIRSTALDDTDVAFATADMLLNDYPQRLLERYKLGSTPESSLELIEIIGRQRGCLQRGGNIQLEKAGVILINELRAGLLGRLTLETPAQAEQEIIEIAEFREAKRLKDLERKQRRKRRR